MPNLDLDYYRSLHCCLFLRWVYTCSRKEEVEASLQRPNLNVKFLLKLHRWFNSTLSKPDTVKNADYCILSKVSPLVRSKEHGHVNQFKESSFSGQKKEKKMRTEKRRCGVGERRKEFALFSEYLRELRPGIYIGKTCSMSFSLRVCQTQGRKVEFYYQ